MVLDFILSTNRMRECRDIKRICKSARFVRVMGVCEKVVITDVDGAEEIIRPCQLRLSIFASADLTSYNLNNSDHFR